MTSTSTAQQPKTVLITGASRGIGLQFAKHYTQQGWNVIATARNPETAQKLTDLSPWKLVKLDTGDEQSIVNAAGQLASVPIDLLINNAGVGEGGGINVTTKTDLMHQFEINVVGPFLMTRALLPSLKLASGPNGSALVVHISSYAASIHLNSKEGFAEGGMYGYRASKAALSTITKSLAVDLRSDRVGLLPLSPGFVATDINNHAEGAMSVETSVAGMAQTIAAFTLADSGSFLDFDGKPLSW